MERYGVEGVRFYSSHKELIDSEPELDAVWEHLLPGLHDGPLPDAEEWAKVKDKLDKLER